MGCWVLGTCCWGLYKGAEASALSIAGRVADEKGGESEKATAKFKRAGETPALRKCSVLLSNSGSGLRLLGSILSGERQGKARGTISRGLPSSAALLIVNWGTGRNACATGTSGAAA